MDDNLVVLPGLRSEDADESRVGPVPPDQLLPALEACLFAVGGVLTVTQLATALRVDEDIVEGGLAALRERLARGGSGVRLVPVGEGWQLRTEPRLATWVAAVRGGRPARLSRAALETLAVIAFRQPVSKGIVDDVRGVECGPVLRMLSERGLVRVMGRSEEPGKPILWGTTPAFLELFGLRSLADLPTLRDLRAVDPGGEGSVVVLDQAREDIRILETMMREEGEEE
jgi:segregation and condensation protein B